MPETIGQRLRQAREERHYSLEKAADSTRIRLYYLQALEMDDYSLIPSAAQARGFLRNYAEFLGLDLDQALADVQRSRPQPSGEVSGPLLNVDVTPDVPTTSHAPLDEGSDTPSLVASWLSRLRRTPVSPETASAPLSGVELDKAETTISTESPKTPEETTEPQSDAVNSEIAHGKPTRPRPIMPDPGLDQSRENSSKTVEAEQSGKISKLRPKKKVSPDGEATQLEQTALLLEETKSEAAAPAGSGEQVETAGETPGSVPSRSLLSRFTSLFRLRFVRNESAEPDSVASESEAESATGTASSATVPTESPEEIFVEIGQRLRKRRELLSLAVDEIERNIRVRGVFIRALEEGAFDRLPSAVQTRGMLANYAAFLDLDTDALLLRFADAIQAGHRMRYPEKPGGNKSPMRVSPSLPPLRSFIAGDLIFGISIAVLLITMAVWGVNRIFSTQSAEQVTLPTAPSISDVLATSQQPTVEQEVTLIPAADTPFLEVVINTPEATLETPAFNPAINVQVNVVVVERTFLRVLVDGEEVLNGRVTPGATYTYEASDLVEILTGNAAALRITYNGRDLGLMGNFGEVANRIYTAEGVVTPTPVVPPTATPTPTSTPTLSSTASATPKSPSPTPGGE